MEWCSVMSFLTLRRYRAQQRPSSLTWAANALEKERCHAWARQPHEEKRHTQGALGPRRTVGTLYCSNARYNLHRRPGFQAHLETPWSNAKNRQKVLIFSARRTMADGSNAHDSKGLRAMGSSNLSLLVTDHEETPETKSETTQAASSRGERPPSGRVKLSHPLLVMLDLNQDGRVDWFDILYLPLVFYGCLEALLGVGYELVPFGPIFGLCLLLVGLQMNVIGLYTLARKLSEFGVSVSIYTTWVTLGYAVTIFIDAAIVVHGIVVGVLSVENDIQAMCDGDTTDTKSGPSRRALGPESIELDASATTSRRQRAAQPRRHRGHTGCCCKCGTCLRCFAHACGFCLRSSLQTGLATAGTAVLWASCLALLSQVVAGAILSLLFRAIELTCATTIDYVKENNASAAASELVEWYHESGVRAIVDHLSGPPFHLGISSSVEDTVDHIAATAGTFVRALEEICAHFDGLYEAAVNIMIGALLSHVAQIICLIFHVKQFTVW